MLILFNLALFWSGQDTPVQEHTRIRACSNYQQYRNEIITFVLAIEPKKTGSPWKGGRFFIYSDFVIEVKDLVLLAL